MTLAILPHLHRGDYFLAFMMLGVVWLAAQAVWGTIIRNRQVYLLHKRHAEKERAHTLLITPEHKDPQIVGDVTRAEWPKGHYPASRANVLRGKA